MNPLLKFSRITLFSILLLTITYLLRNEMMTNQLILFHDSERKMVDQLILQTKTL
jgi:hypothetical protein